MLLEVTLATKTCEEFDVTSASAASTTACWRSGLSRDRCKRVLVSLRTVSAPAG